MEVNPIVIGEDFTRLKSASNLIVIHVGGDWCYFIAFKLLSVIPPPIFPVK